MASNLKAVASNLIIAMAFHLGTLALGKLERLLLLLHPSSLPSVDLRGQPGQESL